jgi:hypothetical protein
MKYKKNIFDIKDFTEVKLKIDKKKNGDLYIDFTPIIKHANKLAKLRINEIIKSHK